MSEPQRNLLGLSYTLALTHVASRALVRGSYNPRHSARMIGVAHAAFWPTPVTRLSRRSPRTIEARTHVRDAFRTRLERRTQNNLRVMP